MHLIYSDSFQNDEDLCRVLAALQLGSHPRLQVMIPTLESPRQVGALSGFVMPAGPHWLCATRLQHRWVALPASIYLSIPCSVCYWRSLLYQGPCGKSPFQMAFTAYHRARGWESWTRGASCKVSSWWIAASLAGQRLEMRLKALMAAELPGYMSPIAASPTLSSLRCFRRLSPWDLSYLVRLLHRLPS